MKYLTYSVVATSGSPKLIGTTQSDFCTTARPGSIVHFIGNNTTFHVNRTDKIFFVRDFQVFDKYISIKENIGFNILKGDNLTLSYKEFELWTLMDIKNSGKNYKVGNIIYVEGGILAGSTDHNKTEPIEFEVIEIEDGGKVKSLGLKNSGLYLESPPKICKTHCNTNIDGGLELELEYLTRGERKIIEREVINVVADHKEAKIYLNYNVPKGVKEGKLSLTKWQIILDQNYTGETTQNAEISICRDFSKHLKMPLVNSNHFSMETSINKSLHAIDKHAENMEREIQELKARIEKLENPATQ